MRVAILWTRLSGYMNACMRELAGRDNVEISVIHEAAGGEAPFEESMFGWIANRYVWSARPDSDSVMKRMHLFSPDILIISGWHIPAYRRVAKAQHNKSLRVMAMDNQWSGTFKQRIGALFAPFYVQPIADMAWVPGDRQAVFARKLGFEQHAILRGLYTCNYPAFEEVYRRRSASTPRAPRSFLYVGRFSTEKGLDTLVEAYELYRKANIMPWPLVCCGAGSLRHLLEGQPGIHVEGFVQPQRLPDLLTSAGCLVLSSVFEPWALVIHEAVSSGLPVLASESAGAAVHLVQPGYNGFIFTRRNAEALANYMSRISAMSDIQLTAMGRASHCLSQQFSPQKWTDTLLDAYSCAAQTGGCSRMPE
jgi:glycosyltransferase involved in cell wall biosynthesis